MIKLFHVGLLLVFALVLGCVTKKLPPTQEIDSHALPSNYDNYKNESSNKELLYNLPWKDFFTDKTLEEYISLALSNNFDLNTAIKNLQIASKSYSQSKLNYWPDLNLLLDGNFTNTSAALSKELRASLQVNWEIDFWLKLKDTRSQFLAEYLKTEAAKQAIRVQIITQVASDYYSLNFLGRRNQLLKKYKTLADNSVNIMELQFQAGNTTQLAVQQNVAQQLGIASMIPKVEQNIYIKKSSLSTLLGTVAYKVDIPDKVARLNTDKYLLGFPADLLKQRPDLKEAEMLLRASSAKANIQLKNMYPSFNINASTGLQFISSSAWYSVPNAIFSVADVSILQPIFNRKKLRMAYEIALLEREKAAINFKKTLVNAVLEVNNIIVQLEKNKRAYAIVANKVLALKKATETAKDLFNSGLANYLDVITVENALINAELEKLDLLQEHSDLSIALYKSVGGAAI